MRARRLILSIVAVVYFVCLIRLAFLPESRPQHELWLWPFLAFLPLGLLLLLLAGRRRWWLALGFSVLAAAWLVAAQSVWMPLGYAKVDDVFWASAGSVAGILVALLLLTPRARVTHPRKPRSAQTLGTVAPAGGRELPED